MQGTFHAGSSQGFRIVYGAQAEREVADGRILRGYFIRHDNESLA
jgi:hypothetical protein